MIDNLAAGTDAHVLNFQAIYCDFDIFSNQF